MKANQKTKPWNQSIGDPHAKALWNKYREDKRHHYNKGRISLFLWGSFFVNPKRKPHTVKSVHNLLRYK